jgi:hypothetical protein
MRTLAKVLLLILAAYAPALAKEIDLYNGAAEAKAYIADDLTIYLWDGEPVAYLDPSRNNTEVDVYGFNGKHLGWFRRGIMFNHEGYAVGAVREAFISNPGFAPFKGFKQFKPFKSFQEFAPFQPIFKKSWSDTSLTRHLRKGIN